MSLSIWERNYNEDVGLKKIIIFGAGEGSREILDIIIKDLNKETPAWEVLGFVDTNKEKRVDSFCGYPMFCQDDFSNTSDTYGVCGIMDNTIRKKVCEEEILGNGLRLASLIHPSAIMPEDFSCGKGTIVYPGVKISYNVRLGQGVIVNYNSVLGHDSIVNDYSFVGPSVTMTGGCLLGSSCLIGAGAVFVPGIEVGDCSIVGAGTFVFSNVKALTSVVSLPQKVTRAIG
jgi:sugar O-acyltransferase (sialic acid O-acetyltransferase NeuD family)